MAALYWPVGYMCRLKVEASLLGKKYTSHSNEMFSYRCLIDCDYILVDYPLLIQQLILRFLNFWREHVKDGACRSP
jgi:hypothetical protein